MKITITENRITIEDHAHPNYCAWASSVARNFEFQPVEEGAHTLTKEWLVNDDKEYQLYWLARQLLIDLCEHAKGKVELLI